MPKSVIAEGKTTNEAIENGLKMLKTTKNNVEIKVLENEEKRSFFSILAPRVIKVELTLKEENKEEKAEKKEYKLDEKDCIKVKENLEKFLSELLSTEPMKDIRSNIEIKDSIVYVNLNGKDINFLIGYRGDVLNSFQTLLTTIGNKNITTRCKVLLDIEGYREKREKTLENLAEKLAKTVIKTKKEIILEPMSAYERKIIHSKLQNNNKVKTHSIGEEPNRKIVISLNK